MRSRSLFSNVVLAGVVCAAGAGWLGVRAGVDSSVTIISAAPAEVVGAAAATTGTGVRDRAAWQPSPMPSQATTSGTSTTQVAAPAAPTTPDRRAAWQPSPMPSTGTSATTGASSSSAPVTTNQAPSLGSIAGIPLGPASGAVLLPQGNTAPAPDAAETAADMSYVPMSEMFTTDKLEAKFNGALPEKRGTWVEQRFFSAALNREDTYLVWLPPGYDSTTQRYPSLYLLHGVGGSSGFGVQEWLGYALTEDLDRMLALGLIDPMIVVLPNVEQSYWMNHSPDTDGTKWADFVAIDLVKDVDARFRTATSRDRRAIGGLSMGAAGALQLALNHPDVFSVVGAHSPTLRPFETSPDFFGDAKWFAQYDPISLAKNTNAASKLAIWMDVGNEDPWRTGAAQLDSVLLQKNPATEFQVLEGEHEGWYWEYYLPEYLNFYSAALNAPTKTPSGAPVVVSTSLLASASVSSHTS